MNSIPSNCFNEQNLSTSINKFFKTFQLCSILTICNCKKLKAINVMMLFSYILCNVFRDRSFYMQTQLNPETINFSQNTYYRFLTNVKSNWLRFTTLLSQKIINSHIRKLTSDTRANCFIVDDSLFDRTSYKHTVSKVFDHVSMKFKKEFRLMTLGQSDGVSFIPINFALLASADDIYAKIVCVKNSNNRKDQIAIICTNTDLSEEEIISIYGKRWDIEVFFKTCKSFLKPGKEYHGLSYDALTAYVAIVFTRYYDVSSIKTR